MQNVTFVSANDDGHRAEYDRVLIGELVRLGISLNKVPSAAMADNAGDALFYPMLDGSPADFLARAIGRSLLGRRTVGLFFRSGECFIRTPIKYRVKYILFRLASRLPG